MYRQKIWNFIKMSIEQTMKCHECISRCSLSDTYSKELISEIFFTKSFSAKCLRRHLSFQEKRIKKITLIVEIQLAFSPQNWHNRVECLFFYLVQIVDIFRGQQRSQKMNIDKEFITVQNRNYSMDRSYNNYLRTDCMRSKKF